MEHSYWLDKWKKGDIKFHQNDVHPQLVKHFAPFPQGKVLVPLCGKSLDMMWFCSQGHQVVGVELSPMACQAFFEENKIKYSQEKQGEFSVFEGEQIQLWCGDFFHAPLEIWSGITSIYDRAALIAFPPEYRKQYTAEIIKKLQDAKIQNFQMLLITLEYPQEKAEGPPFSVSEAEINMLYGKKFKIRRLDHYAENAITGHHPKFMDTQVSESVYKLTFSQHE